MKEKKYIALQIACGEILDVKLVGDKFFINTNEQYMFDLLTEEKNKGIIQNALIWQGINCEIVVNRILKKEEIQEKDFEKLKKLGIEFTIQKGDNNG